MDTEFANRFAIELKKLSRYNPGFFDYFIDGLVFHRSDWIKNRVRELVSGEAKKWKAAVCRTRYMAGPWREPPKDKKGGAR